MIEIKDFSFVPNSLVAHPGDTVTWINSDQAVHNILAEAFHSPDLNQGDEFKHTFNEPGTFVYNCGIHPTMLGKIIVE